MAGRLSVRLCGRSEIGVDELHRHCSFAHRSDASLGRPRAGITGREDAGHIGFEQVVGVRGGAREDEAVVVAGDRVVKPFGAWPRTEEEEQVRERQALRRS